MKSFRTIFARDLDSVSLKGEMEAYGYVFIRDLMPKGDLEPLLSDMIGIASDEGWMIRGVPHHRTALRIPPWRASIQSRNISRPQIASSAWSGFTR